MRFCIFVFFAIIGLSLNAQDNWSAFEGISMQYEMQISASDHKTPLWLNANKYGLSSLSKTNGYIRAALERDISRDSDRKVGIGYGFDVAVPYQYSTNLTIQQLYTEFRYKRFTFSLGSKYHPMELKNQELSSGSQTFGINARPVPQLRISVDDYYTLPYTRGWISVKGHFAYGYMTDGRWQKDFSHQEYKWTEGALYHSKAGYLKVGNASKPISFEIGLEMAAVFGGKVNWYYEDEDRMLLFDDKIGISDFWHAFIPSGSDYREEEIGYTNVEGNQLGSWVARLTYDHRDFSLSLYADHFFEDHSAIYHLGYYGYGIDGDWQKRNRRLYLYPLKDGQLGLDLKLKKQDYVKNIVVEFMNTMYQSGPVYHDHTINVYDQIGGRDNYYNHTYYPGWQYYGQVIGNPLFRSPSYNEDARLEIKNNRFFAWHFGINGYLSGNCSYRLLSSWQKGFGTYEKPFDKSQENFSMLFETEYDLSSKIAGLTIRAAYGIDRGGLLGDNQGIQMSLILRR